MFSLSITPFAYLPQFYDECLLAPVLPYRGDLHKAVHDIIRSVTPLKKITTLNFFITFEMTMLTASKYYNSETSALWNIAPTKLASTSQALNTSMDLLCMQYYLPVTPMLIAESSSLIGMLFRMVTKDSFVSIHLLALFCGLRWKQTKFVAFMSADCLNEMTIISFISMALWIADLLCFPCLLLSVMRIVKITWVSSLLLTTRQLLPWRSIVTSSF